MRSPSADEVIERASLPTNAAARGAGTAVGPLVLVFAVVLIAVNLRPAITSVGPVIGEIRTDTGISGTAAGLLTTLPLIAFGLLAPVATRLGVRFGIESVLLASMLLLAAAIALRSAPTLVALYVGTGVLGAAVALGNVLLPALVKRDFPTRAGPLTAIYSSAVGAGAGLGTGLSVPLAVGLGLDWRIALAAWAIPAAIAALAWLHLRGRRHRPEPAQAAFGSLLRTPLAWQVTLFFGLQSFGFYASVAWLPNILMNEGLDSEAAGWIVSLAQFSGIASSLLLPVLAERRRDQRPFVILTTAFLVAGFGGVLFAGSTATSLWAILIGLGQGAGLGLALLFCVLRAPDARMAAELSGMTQAIGYLIAATAPALGGLLHDASGAWTATLALIIVAGALQLMAGLGAGRDLQVPRT